MVNVDTIVVGSGIGGLGAALALSNIGHKVLVLEQHYLPGGWCHTFAIDGHKFSPGVHYVGQLQPDGSLRKILEGLGLGGAIEFLELNPDGYDHVVFQDETFDIPKGRDRFQRRLIERFPAERIAINRYFDLMQKVNQGLEAAAAATTLWGKIQLLFRSPSLVFSGLKPLSRIIDREFNDPKLKAILESRAGDHGANPAAVPFVLQAAVDCHYWEGAWYPKGGGGAIPRAFIRRLKKNGSDIRTGTRVDRILIEERRGRRRAVGVKLSDGEEIRSKCVVSNADVWTTYQQLVGAEYLSRRQAAKVSRMKPSVSALSLFMAADVDVDALGLDSGNYWILNDQDVSATYRQAEQADLSEAGPFAGAFLTITTKKDPGKMSDGLHSLEAFTFVSFDAFKQWQASSTGDRPKGYETFKRHLTERMLDTIQIVIPGLRNHLRLCELGTPLTNNFYVAAHRGNLYGQAKLLHQIGPQAPAVRTEIEGLFHCGQSTQAHGVLGALTTGIMAASSIARQSVDDLLVFEHLGSIRCVQASGDSGHQTATDKTHVG